MSFYVIHQGYTSWRTCRSSASSWSPESPATDVCASAEPLAHYDRLVQCGSLRKDAQQRHLLQELAQLQLALKNYSTSIYLNPPPARLDVKDNNSQLQKHQDPCITTVDEVTQLLNWDGMCFENLLSTRCIPHLWLVRCICWLTAQ